MNEYLSISFSKELSDFDSYFKKFDKRKYGGKLQKGINSQKLIWLDEERMLISKKRFEVFNNWLKNFEKLINLYGFVNNEETEHLKQFIESKRTLEVFKGLEKDDYFNDLGLDFIFLLFIRILEQPFYYIEATEEFDVGLNEYQKIWYRYNFLRDKISSAKNKFQRSYERVRNDIIIFIQSEPDKTVRLFKEIILVTEQLQIRMRNIDFKYSFEFSKSPLFAVYMDFVKDVQYYLNYLDRGGKLPLINRYLDKIEEYEKPFEIIMLPAPETAEIKFLTLPEMFTKPALLGEICKKLIELKIVTKNTEEKLLWQGHQHKTRGIGLQLVALSICCKEFYNKSYSYKEIHKAYTTYFNYPITDTNFKKSQLFEAEKYLYLFSFVNSI